MQKGKLPFIPARPRRSNPEATPDTSGCRALQGAFDMRVLVMVKASKDSEAGVMPDTELLASMGRYNEELAKAGILLAGEGLHPSSRGARIRIEGEQRRVIDGPFAPTGELVAGFWLWQVRSMQEAIEWARRCPRPHREECDLEIRPLFEHDDFGDALTPELRAQEARLLDGLK
jgi:hypothetical protein